jgi:hypothetical protein
VLDQDGLEMRKGEGKGGWKGEFRCEEGECGAMSRSEDYHRDMSLWMGIHSGRSEHKVCVCKYGVCVGYQIESTW